MLLQSPLEITTTELLERGWTRTLIKRFLPVPDGCVPVGYWANWRGQDTYSAIKVWNVQQTKAFEDAFLRSWKGRKRWRDAGTTPEAVLAEMRSEPHPRIPPRSKAQIARDTILRAAAAHLNEARSRGYRTPHG